MLAEQNCPALQNAPGIEDATKIFLSENGNFAFVGDKDGDIAVFKVTGGKLSLSAEL